MQTALTYRTNRDLFSNYYLDEHLPETEEWDKISDEELRDAKEDVLELWEREKDTAPKRNESQLEEKFIRPMFRKLGIPFEVEESTSRTNRRPDYGFFESEKAAKSAFERRDEGGDFYRHSVAVADAKRWGRPFDTRGSGEHERDFENPSYQIHVYLQETPARWAVLTDGKKWRLYYGPTSHRLDSYYEIDLPTVLEKGDLEDFKYFYLFFRHDAFLEKSSGECFLDEVYDESNVFAQELGEDLQDNIYKAIKVLSEGFIQYPDNDLTEADLDLIHDSSLIYLYRLIFVLYAESEGRDLLDTNNNIYEESYSLNSLKQTVAEELDGPSPKYQEWQNNLWSRLDELFKLIDQGSKSRGIPEEDLYIPAYNGGLFRTDPDEEDSAEARFLAKHRVGDAYLAEVINLLTRSQNGNGGEKIFVDYSSLDVRHLGSIYEGLLEYKLEIADTPLELDEGEYVPSEQGEDVVVQEGEVYLRTDSGERKATGSYYTPEYVVEYMVHNTLGPLVENIRMDLAAQSAFDEGGFASEFAERVFDLKILDPAMGSGHFLTSATDYLAREIIDAQEKQAAQEGAEAVNEENDINWARRQVAQRCIYGVDLNPLAVELAKVSLWLRTLAAEQPLAFLDHHLRAGNSLVGSDLEQIEKLESDRSDRRENATLADFGIARKGTIEQLMHIYTDFIAIENKELADVKEIESKYDEFEQNKLRQRLEAIANVDSSEIFGLESIPSDSHERMVSALNSDKEWKHIEKQEWFKTAQNWAEEKKYFHWKLEFPEVFYQDDGEVKSNPGFDAVIGNPPYVTFGGRWTGEVEEGFDEAMRSQFPETAEYKLNTYSLFIQRGKEVLQKQKRISYITPDSFLTGSYFKNLREYILDYTSISELFLLAYDVWDAGDVGYSVIFELVNSPSELEPVSLKRATDRERFESPEQFEIEQEAFESYPEQKFYLFFSDAEFSIFNNIWENSQRLGDVVDFYTGLRSRTSKKEMTSNSKKGEQWKKGLSVGKDVRRYVIWGDPIYIEIDEEKLYGGYDLEKYENEKIFMRKTGDKIIASRDGDGLVAFDNLHTINIEDDNYPTEVILAILNSELIEYYYNLTSSSKGRVLPQLNIESLEKLPIPLDPDEKTSKDIQSMVQKIESQKSEFRTEAKGFLSWVSREWGCELDELSLKTHLREYWEYDFEEMLRVAKKNSAKINGEPTSRKFQERLEKEWEASVDKLEDLQMDIQITDEKIDTQVYELYGLTSTQVSEIKSEKEAK